MVLQLDCKHNGFSPEALRELHIVHDCMHLLKKLAVEGLHHAIMLRCVV